MDAESCYLPATSLLECYGHGELSPVAVVDVLTDRIDRLDGTLNALRARDLERARRDAAASARRWRERRPRALEGLPVVVKDLVDTAGLATAYGSGMFAGHTPDRDAAAVERLRAEGAIVLAKGATHEFGWGITTESATFGPTRNPWNPDRVVGGSSGGSAAALAAGYAPLAIGSDTAGSIRIPAAFCGVAGLKPTYGAIDTTGTIALAPSLDHLGPMARTVADLRLLWRVLADQPPEPAGRRDLTVGICPDLDQVRPGPVAESARDAVVSVLDGLGVKTKLVRAPGLPPVYPTLATTLLVEGHRTHTELGLWPRRAGEYGADVRARLELAGTVGLADYVEAQRARTLLRSALARLFGDVDVLLSPISAVGPPLIGAADPAPREQVITFTAPQSLTGLPALAVRAGFDDAGLPVGVQLTAPPWREPRLLELGELVERASWEIQLRRPQPAG